jgi:hypothetical protein
MPTIYNQFAIQADGSGSTSSTNAITLFYNSSSYNNLLTSGALATIKATTVNATAQGAQGQLEFVVSTSESIERNGLPIMKLSFTGSEDEPRVGIGFSSAEPVLRPLDVKSKSDSTQGTDLLIRSSRLTRGAIVGDEGGSINFVIDSGSYEDITTSGSIARIKTKVDTETSDGGVSGRLILTVARGVDVEVDAMEVGYGEGSYPNFYTVLVGSSSLEVADRGDNSDLKNHNTISHTFNGLATTIIGVDYAGTENSGGYIQVNDGEGTGSIFLHGSSGEITASVVSASRNFLNDIRLGNQINLTDSTSNDYIAYDGNGFFYKGNGKFLGTITGSNLQLTGVPAGSESTFLTIDGSGNIKTNTAGVSGTSGSSGSSGTSGSSGSSGQDGANGTSGSSGSSGQDGANGTSGSSGSSGQDGANGTSGSSGSSGQDGANGTSGSSGSSGQDGANGTSGSSGSSGQDGANGTSGSSGSSGQDGANGTSGSSGSSGQDGANGTSGSSGSSGQDGNPGTSGSSGTSGGGSSITNPNNNSVLTSDGTTTGIIAEANLIFDGTILDVTNTISASRAVTAPTGSFSYLTGKSPLIIENPDGITFRSSVLHDVNGVRIIEVTQASELPTSLADNATYIIRGDITIPNGSEITTGENSVVMGLDRNKDCITYTGSGTLFTVQNDNFTLSNLKLRASGSTGKVLHANDLNPGLAVNNYGRLKVLNIEQCEFRNCYNIMTVEGFELVDLSNTLIWYSDGTTGAQFQAVRHLELSSCEFYNWYEENPGAAPSGYSTARMIELLPTTGSGNVGNGVVNIGTNIIHAEQTQIGLYVDPSSTTSFGTIAANTFIDAGITTGANLGGSTYDSGSMLNYDVGINQGIEDATAEIFLTLSGNSTATTFGRSGGTTQANLGGGTVERSSQRMGWDNSNEEVGYEGSKDIKALLNIALSGEKGGGGSNTYTFDVRKDTGGGYVTIPGSGTTITTSGGTINVSKSIITDFMNGDKLAIFITATGSDSFTVEDLQWTIIQI